MTGVTTEAPPVREASAGEVRPATTRARRSPAALSRGLLWFTVPALAFYGFAVVVPTLRGGQLALTDWDGLSRNYEFVGFDNFVRIFTTESSLNALKMTLIFAVAITILQNGIGLLLALGVNTGLKSRNFLRVVFFAPVVVTPVVVAYLWKFMLAPDGAVDSALHAVGLGSLSQTWLGDPTWAAVSVVMVVVWQHAGYSMVIYLAGLQAVPQELHEAAAVDGAGVWRRFRSVTWPLLAPATTINVVLTIIGGLKMFTEVYVLTGGGPGGSTETLSTLLYKSAFQFDEFGYGIALALVLAAIVGLFSVVQFRLSSGKGVD
ncbi:raffinose/stachyose/melibiose transport system permease protein [Micromonospora pallida]|uniref:Raffinose/stachyose/melibiose transport system permease protein n=1 Tax=Micromonospora pallida TaxID=145854 RepID=A0A1C6SFN8_9ACTN|nr:sugar ABC transporter permease [Micromonospora pallida]SCL28300.1 raffinose/stachyose/melibiose transport system permease protein [Micromonospora pallida]